VSEYRDPSGALRARIEELLEQLGSAKAEAGELALERERLELDNASLEAEIERARRAAARIRFECALNALLFAPVAGVLAMMVGVVALMLVLGLFLDNPAFGVALVPAYVIGVFSVCWVGRALWRGTW
jgi:hypothetical protein